MPEATRDSVIRNTNVLIEAAKRFNLPIVVSQQYPKGLGPTVSPIEDGLRDAANVHRFDKLEFSAASTAEFSALAPSLLCGPEAAQQGSMTRGKRDQWLVTGMEAHVCVYQTVRGLVDRGYQVHVVADAVSSRTEENWQIGLNLAERAGGIITSTEVAVFDLLGRAGTEDFKALSKLIK